MASHLRNRVYYLCLTITLLTAASVSAQKSPEAMLAGADQRADAVFRAESGEPLVRAKKRPPLSPGRGNYVRAYSFSMMGFAARCLYLGEQLDQANAALAENAQHYLDHPRDINDRDSFHWHADVAMRLIEMYGTNGDTHPGRITPETESLMLEPIWLYAKACSSLAKADVEQSKTWHIYSSENHHTMDFAVNWHFAKLAKDRPQYKELRFDDGHTAAEHYAAWNDYFVAYCRERARKGICVEMMSGGYNSTMIKSLYNFYDFGPPNVQSAAGKLFDLYFAYWSQEQIDGVQGGGKSRIYFDKGLRARRDHGMAPLAWLYFGIGERPAVHGHDINALLSDYRPPAVVADIALDVEGRGRYEVYQRVQGLGEQGRTDPLVTVSSKHPNKLRTDGGGILRYSYCDPAFIMGTPMHEARPLSDWVHISAQNRWQGVIFPGKDDARIVPIARPANNWRALNAQWSVQHKGTLITQKLKSNKGAAQMIVWLSKEGLSEPEEEDDIVFVESAGAYAAIRTPTTGYTWQDGVFNAQAKTGDRKSRPGRVLVLDDDYAPVIVEVMAKTDIKSFAAFKQRVKSSAPEVEATLLSYTSVYGDRLTFDFGYRQPPTINGEPVDYAPKHVYDSPFLKGNYNAGVVTITKGERKKVLDFNAP
jgi:hypothetical protein